MTDQEIAANIAALEAAYGQRIASIAAERDAACGLMKARVEQIAQEAQELVVKATAEGVARAKQADDQYVAARDRAAKAEAALEAANARIAELLAAPKPTPAPEPDPIQQEIAAIEAERQAALVEEAKARIAARAAAADSAAQAAAKAMAGG